MEEDSQWTFFGPFPVTAAAAGRYELPLAL